MGVIIQRGKQADSFNITCSFLVVLTSLPCMIHDLAFVTLMSLSQQGKEELLQFTGEHPHTPFYTSVHISAEYIPRGETIGQGVCTFNILVTTNKLFMCAQPC